MALSAVIVWVVVAIAIIVHFVLEHYAKVNSEKIARQIIESATKREQEFDAADKTPAKNRTESEIREELKSRR